MQRISIISVGKLKEKYLREAAAEYSKRLQTMCRFEIIEVDEERISDAPNDTQIKNTLISEGKRILSKISRDTFVTAMCIEGRQIPSEKLAKLFADNAVRGISSMAFVIGGSYGLSDEVKNRADLRLSMSEMTFPHQLARVMLCEQIYRAFRILHHEPYHK